MGEDLTLESPYKVQVAFNEDELIPDFILKKVEKHVEAGKTTWITDSVTGDSQDFSEFEAESRKIACSLFKRGMRKGDTAIFMTYYLAKLHTFFMGVWRANGIIRSTYPEDDADTLAFRVEESRAGWILCDAALAEMCLEVAERMYWEVEVIVIGEHEGCTPFQELLEDDGSEMPDLEICGEDPALILPTSGTTGRSKGAVHTHRTVVNALSTTMLMPFTTDKPNLLVTKGSHITGSLFPLTLLCSGSQGVVMSTVSKQGIFEAVHNFKPGLIWGFPTFLLLLVNDPEASEYDFSSLEVVATGGAQVTPAMEKAMARLENLDAFVNCYGLTEVSPLTAEMDFDDSDRVKLEGVPPFSVGKVIPGVSLQIRNPDTGEVLGAQERGEICVKSQCMFTHYLNNKEATDNAFIEGWFRTGDMGYYDDNGFVFIVDRIKEIFKYWNNHISPSEIEDIINQHDAVGEVCVIGVEDPEGGGSVPRAYVTLQDSEASPEEIIQFANDRLPNYKHIRGGLHIVSELPKGKSGKIQRSLVAEMTIEATDVVDVQICCENNGNEGENEESHADEAAEETDNQDAEFPDQETDNKDPEFLDQETDNKDPEFPDQETDDKDSDFPDQFTDEAIEINEDVDELEDASGEKIYFPPDEPEEE